MPSNIQTALVDAAPEIEKGVSQASAARLFPPGGARNAFDCALWDLQATLTGLPVSRLLGMAAPEPLLPTSPVGHGTPVETAVKPPSYREARPNKATVGRATHHK